MPNRPLPFLRRLAPCAALSLYLLLSAAAARADDLEPGFSPLFNGRDLSGWEGAAGFWRVDEGAITGETTAEHPLPHHSYLISTHAPLDDFELRLSFRLHSGNSGVQYRSRRLGDFDVAGYQCNIETKKPGRTAILEEMKNGRGGALAEVGQRVQFDPDGTRHVLETFGSVDTVEAGLDGRGWNQLRIIAQGDRLIHELNGHAAVDVVDRQQGKAARSGILALQLHIGKPMKVQFKDIRVRILTPSEP